MSYNFSDTIIYSKFKSKKRFLHSINAHGHSPSQSPVVTGGSRPNLLATEINCNCIS